MSIHQVLVRALSAGVRGALGFSIAVAFVGTNDARAVTKTITCPKGEKRAAIEADDLTRRLDYSPIALPLAVWLSAAPEGAVDKALFRQPLSELAEWSQWMSGLAERWNSCALTRADLDSGVPRIYERLKADAAEFDKLREARAASPPGRPGDAKKLADALASFDADVRHLARLAGREYVLDRIAAEIRELDLQEKGDGKGAWEAII